MLTGNDALACGPEDLDLLVPLGLHLALAWKVFPPFLRHSEEELVAVGSVIPTDHPSDRLVLEPHLDQLGDGAESIDVEADDAACVWAEAHADAQHSITHLRDLIGSE